MTRRALLPLGCALAVAVLAACSEDATEPPGPPVGILVTPGDTTFQDGRSVQYGARLVDSAGTTIPGATFTWSSNAGAVASVSPSGMVTAHQVGLAMIMATSDTFATTVSVRIVDSLITSRVDYPAEGPVGLAVSGTHAYATLASTDQLAVLDVPGESASTSVPTGDLPTSVAVNSAGTRAYVTNQFGGSLGVFDLATNASVGTVPIPGSPYVTLTSADNATVWATSGSLNRVYAINATTLAITDSARTPSGPNGLARHPTLARLYVSGSFDGNVYELDATTLDSLRTWVLGGSAQAMVVSADGSTLFVANETGRVDVITLASGAVGTPVTVAGTPYGLAMSPDGTRLAVSSTSGSVVVLNTATLALVKTVNTGGVPRRLAYRPDGTRLLVANEAGWVDFIR